MDQLPGVPGVIGVNAAAGAPFCPAEDSGLPAVLVPSVASLSNLSPTKVDSDCGVGFPHFMQVAACAGFSALQ